MARLLSFFGLIAVAAATVYAGPITVNLGPSGAAVTNGNIVSDGYIPSSGQTLTSANLSTGTVTFSTDPFTNIATVPFYIAPNSSGYARAWSSEGAVGNQSITIDVGSYTGASTTSGIYGTDQIFTMINSVYATAGSPYGAEIVLSGYEANGTTAISETINLLNGVDYRSLSNVLGGSPALNPTPCDVANIGSATLGTNCTGSTSATAQTSGTDSSAVSALTIGGSGTAFATGPSITVYNSVYGASDTNGNSYYLDAQDINLGTVGGLSPFANGWLNSVKVISENGPGGVSNAAVLTALTVDGSLLPPSVPEPSPLSMLVIGLLPIAFFQLRRKQAAAKNS